MKSVEKPGKSEIAKRAFIFSCFLFLAAVWGGVAFAGEQGWQNVPASDVASALQGNKPPDKPADGSDDGHDAWRQADEKSRQNAKEKSEDADKRAAKDAAKEAKRRLQGKSPDLEEGYDAPEGSEEQKTAGKKAGEEMKKALQDAGIDPLDVFAFAQGWIKTPPKPKPPKPEDKTQPPAPKPPEKKPPAPAKAPDIPIKPRDVVIGLWQEKRGGDIVVNGALVKRKDKDGKDEIIRVVLPEGVTVKVGEPYKPPISAPGAPPSGAPGTPKAPGPEEPLFAPLGVAPGTVETPRGGPPRYEPFGAGPEPYRLWPERKALLAYLLQILSGLPAGTAPDPYALEHLYPAFGIEGAVFTIVSVEEIEEIEEIINYLIGTAATGLPGAQFTNMAVLADGRATATAWVDVDSALLTSLKVPKGSTKSLSLKTDVPVKVIRGIGFEGITPVGKPGDLSSPPTSGSEGPAVPPGGDYYHNQYNLQIASSVDVVTFAVQPQSTSGGGPQEVQLTCIVQQESPASIQPAVGITETK